MSCVEMVGEFIRSQGLLEPGQAVVVGVSGGPDSLCLMDVLHRLGYPLVVAHFDHGLRPESGEEAEKVQALAADLDLVFELGHGRMKESAGLEKTSPEAAAREARYRFLIRVANDRGVRWVATGHTADDQVETIVMNWLRGAGPDGLRGMLPLAPIGTWPAFGGGVETSVQLARPLIVLGRGDTRAYCERHGLRYVSDPSNRDLRFLRNRVRHELLETLESYNPGVRQALLRTGRVMGAVAEWLDAQVADAWGACVRRAGESALALNAEAVGRLHVALQRRLLRRALDALRVPTREAGFETVERLREALLGRSSTRSSLPGGLELERVGGEWLLAEPGAKAAFPAFPLLEAPGETILPEAGSVALSGGWLLRVESGPPNGALADHPPGPDAALIDADALPQGLVLRSPQPGDRLAPLGMQGSVKLSDMFIDRKVPRRLRSRWPLVVSGDTILWVTGLRRGEAAPIGPSTRRVISLKLDPPAGIESGRAMVI